MITAASRPQKFLSTPSARRATPAWQCFLWSKYISIHALREEGDMQSGSLPALMSYFYPRPPRGGRQAVYCTPCRPCTISIHALREEGDAVHYFPASDLEPFLSTPSARRATGINDSGSFHVFDFYPRPPRGGRLMAMVDNPGEYQFLSTPSARRATCPPCRILQTTPISIHALREEGDKPIRFFGCSMKYFYPRPPRGGRQIADRDTQLEQLFLSTPSARRATISMLAAISVTLNFYPRPPRGGRPSTAPSASSW